MSVYHLMIRSVHKTSTYSILSLNDDFGFPVICLFMLGLGVVISNVSSELS